jgi:hypothetical protein
MTELNVTPAPAVTPDGVDPYLRHLKLTLMADNYVDLAKQAAHNPTATLQRLV